MMEHNKKMNITRKTDVPGSMFKLINWNNNLNQKFRWN